MKATIICFSGHGTTGVVSGAPIGATIIHTKSLRMRWYIWLRSILALSLSLNTRRWTEPKEDPHNFFTLAMVYLVTIYPCSLSTLGGGPSLKKTHTIFCSRWYIELRSILASFYVLCWYMTVYLVTICLRLRQYIQLRSVRL